MEPHCPFRQSLNPQPTKRHLHLNFVREKRVVTINTLIHQQEYYILQELCHKKKKKSVIFADWFIVITTSDKSFFNTKRL